MHSKSSPLHLNNNSAHFKGERAYQQALATPADSRGAMRGLLIAALVATPVWILLYSLLHQTAASFR
jgi:hypothetical protein